MLDSRLLSAHFLHRTYTVRLLTLAAVLIAVGATAGLAGQEPGAAVPAAQSYPLSDASVLTVIGGKAEPAEYLGRKAVRLTTSQQSDIFAFVKGSALQDGAIDVDIAVKITVPPGVRMPGFTGMAFRARADGSHYDMFYLRPRNAEAEDQAMRNHAVQYVAKPGFDWYPLRRQWPWVYEAWADLKPETWTHVRIELHGRTARLFLNGSSSPSLIVNGLKGEDLSGGVALWGYPGEESYFSNLRVTPEKPAPIHNGGEAAGSWHVTFGSDYGRFQGTLELHREGAALTGTWSGDFGSALPVSGTWRDGYVELAFTANWPKEYGKPETVPAPAALAGWIDGDSAAGRMKVEGRADGVWSAERKK